MSKLENALVWLYIKTWGKFGDHVIQEKQLWNFTADDLEAAIMGLAYPRKKEKTELVKALTDLIMEKFEEGGMAAFREWSGEIHEQVIETLQQTVELDAVDKQPTSQQQQPAVDSLTVNYLTVNYLTIKILQWDPGKYL